MPNNLTDTEENRLLDLSLLDGDKLALTTTVPTDSAAGTEVAGGSYARQTIDWANAAGGSKATAASISFNDLPTADVMAWEVWSSDGSQRKWYGLFSTRLGAATAATDLITTTVAHGYVDNDQVFFVTGGVPTGLVANTKYYVRDSTSTTFKVASTLGGSALDITADTSSLVMGKVRGVVAGSGITIASGALACTIS